MEGFINKILQKNSSMGLHDSRNVSPNGGNSPGFQAPSGLAMNSKNNEEYLMENSVSSSFHVNSSQPGMP
jgi:hypothetical protein